MPEIRYYALLKNYEAAGALIGALPGAALVLMLKAKARQNADFSAEAGKQDDTVWPPPPSNTDINLDQKESRP